MPTVTRARDLMTTNVLSVAPDTPVQRIAQLLLEHGISAVPVVDKGIPVGIISESDLVERQRPEGVAWQSWVMGLLQRAQPQSATAAISGLACAARDIMSTPVVTASENADAGMLMDLMGRHAIKRILIVRTGRIAGLVSRTDLLRWVSRKMQTDAVPHHDRLALLGARLRELSPKRAGGSAPPAAEEVGDLTASGLRDQVRHYQEALVRERAEARRKAAALRAMEIDTILNGRVSEDAWRKMLLDARHAAARGEREWQVMRMPRQVCSDDGRAIIIGGPDWAGTLRGEAAEVWARWHGDLRDKGFTLAARVLDYRDGIPADIGLFLVWDSGSS